MANQSSNVITVTSLADSGSGSLRTAIAAATSGDTIRFAASLSSQTIKLTSGQIEISAGKNLTIDGADVSGLTISGNNASRLFLLNSSSATPTHLAVKNLTLADGYTSDRGGAISTTHQGVLSIENVTFNNNVADQGGGAIFSAFEGTLTVDNSRFNGNKAIAGNDERGAGAIAFWGPRNLTIRNSEFVNNQGINGGAINSLNGKLTIDNSRFINNSTTAAHFDTSQPNDSLRGYGGAVYTDRASSANEASGQIQITNSLFQGNRGRGEGGAAYLYTGNQDSVVISGSQFQDNEILELPNGGNAGNGGGLVVLSNGLNQGLTIDRTTFVDNTANNQGGGLWMMGAPTNITNSTFTGNQAVGSDYNRNGGGLALYGPTNIVNSTIANNYAGWVGGGVAADSSTVTVKNTIFYNNTAGNGGNDWKIRQQTSRELTNGGGNIQFPGLLSNQFNRFNDGTATANIRVVDPQLGPLQNNGGGILTYALLLNSPALNTGVAGAPRIDQRGQLRDSQPDVGAVEGGASSPNSGGGQENAPGSGLGNQTLKGRSGKDILLGGSGDDLLVGNGGSDTLTGGTGRDYFLYSGKSRQAALAGSLVKSIDRINDFDFSQGDRFQLNFDNKLSTGERPIGLGNAGTIKAGSLVAAARLAYADKNQSTRGKQAIRADEALFFTWGAKTYLSINDTIAAFSANHDLVVNLTGATLRPGDAKAGALSVKNYFA